VSEPPSSKGFGIVGFGVAACAVCCAGPILGFLGGLSAAGLASAWLVGWAGAVVAGLAAVAWLVVRRRRRGRACAPPTEQRVPVAPPVRRVP
jgi:mercuric ion transport protein